MRAIRNPGGRTYLHVWREGTAYETQKGMAFHREWTCVRFSLLPVSGDAAFTGDVRRGLPFADATFDAAYLCHVLEHLTPHEAARFVAEAHRVLKPGAICRVSTPDLEACCREYLRCLEAASAERAAPSLTRYRWAVLDLIDQMVRDRPGGRMLEALLAGDLDREQVRARNGDVFDHITSAPAPSSPLLDRARAKSASQLRDAIIARLYGILRGLRTWGHRDVPRRFREANMWMYDRLSLCLALEHAGFEQVSERSFAESGIEDWPRYDFDRSSRGNYPLEPSVYVEGRKRSLPRQSATSRRT